MTCFPSLSFPCMFEFPEFMLSKYPILKATRFSEDCLEAHKKGLPLEVVKERPPLAINAVTLSPASRVKSRIPA